MTQSCECRTASSGGAHGATTRTFSPQSLDFSHSPVSVSAGRAESRGAREVGIPSCLSEPNFGAASGPRDVRPELGPRPRARWRRTRAPPPRTCTRSRTASRAEPNVGPASSGVNKNHLLPPDLTGVACEF